MFLDRVATIAATLYGTSKDAIFGEHIRQHRRTMRQAGGVILFLIFFLIGTIRFGIQSEIRRQALSRCVAPLGDLDTGRGGGGDARGLSAPKSPPGGRSLGISEEAGERRSRVLGSRSFGHSGTRAVLVCSGTRARSIPSRSAATLGVLVSCDDRSVRLWKRSGDGNYAPARVLDGGQVETRLEFATLAPMRNMQSPGISIRRYAFGT